MAEARNARLLSEPELLSRLGELREAIEQFNRRWYFESHETLEELWMVTPFPERTFLQGIIQLAAAFVHLVRGEYPGVVKLLDASAEKLAGFTPSKFGVDVTRLLDDVARARAEIAGLGPDGMPAWDERRAPVIALAPATRD